MLAHEIEDLQAGRLSLDCPSMVLSNGSAEKPRRFSGPGRLSLDENGRLQLVLYDPEHDPDPGALLLILGPGEWVAESEVYDLEAVDLAGTTWRSGNLTVGVSAHVARPGAIVRASPATLTSEEERVHGGREWCSLYFPHRVEAPRNVTTVTTAEETDTKLHRRSSERNVWAIGCEGMDVRMRFHEGGFEVDAISRNGSLPQDLAAIVEESIWFTLGQPVRADVVRYRRAGREGILVHSRGRDDALASAMPPYHIHIVDSAAVLGAMFSRYLAHVSVGRDGRYHPLSVLIRRALRAEAGTLEEAALARCVVVEGIADLAFPDLGKPSPKTLKAVVALEDLLREHLESSLIRTRVEGFFGALRGRNARAALHSLAEQGVVTDDQLEAWERLRHVAAHGREYQLPLREVFELSQKVRVLMSRLVFESIGYAGAYTDYGSPGWPVRNHRDKATPQGLEPSAT
jgi:hypothetical protein